jgi:hypothetical protein
MRSVFLVAVVVVCCGCPHKPTQTSDAPGPLVEQKFAFTIEPRRPSGSVVSISNRDPWHRGPHRLVRSVYQNHGETTRWAKKLTYGDPPYRDEVISPSFVGYYLYDAEGALIGFVKASDIPGR